MTTTICPTCGGVKEVRGTSGGTSPLPEAMSVKKWCACAKLPDWQSFTFSPPEIIVQKDIEIANLSAELAALRAELELTKSELSNARGEASRLQALIERRRIERDDIRVSETKWEETALRVQREVTK